jgi:hypothetical protein
LAHKLAIVAACWGSIALGFTSLVVNVTAPEYWSLCVCRQLTNCSVGKLLRRPQFQSATRKDSVSRRPLTLALQAVQVSGGPALDPLLGNGLGR